MKLYHTKFSRNADSDLNENIDGLTDLAKKNAPNCGFAFPYSPPSLKVGFLAIALSIAVNATACSLSHNLSVLVIPYYILYVTIINYCMNMYLI